MKTPTLLLLLALANPVRHAFAQQENGSDRTFYIILIILAISLGGRAISSWIANRNRQHVGLPPVHGALGGTICPHCAQPYAFHLWSFNFVVRRIDRCPHCGKWRVVKRYPPSVLDASAEAMLAAQNEASSPATTLSPEEQLRHKLDDSRFDET
ncbi:MAG: hypothetical protein H6658_01620 [Ardenticatenaceae bacterium]|nr:hypothetical protein [Ardenticatenaceae bacterium]